VQSMLCDLIRHLWEMSLMIRNYSELQKLASIKDRFDYLALSGVVGEMTFGSDRWLNQMFYTSYEWRHIRRQVILRDNGCDLGMDGWDIHKGLYIHHMNPITKAQIVEGDEAIFDPEFLITASHATHNAIHYGDPKLLPRVHIERSSGDTKLW
jgi:hypothetical protein